MPSLSPSAPASITRTADNGFPPIASTITPAISRAEATFASGIRPTSTQRGNGARAPLTARRRQLRPRAAHRSAHWPSTGRACVRRPPRQTARRRPSAAHDQNSVSERHHLIELDRYKQDRTASVAPLQQLLAVDEFYCPDVDPAGRLADQQHLRLAV